MEHRIEAELEPGQAYSYQRVISLGWIDTAKWLPLRPSLDCDCVLVMQSESSDVGNEFKSCCHFSYIILRLASERECYAWCKVARALLSICSSGTLH